MLLGMKRVLVTGGAGFIGSNFLHWLARNTDASWTVLDSLTYAGNLASFEGLPSERHAFVEGSVADLDLVSELVEAHDAVIIACPEHNGAMPAAFKNLIDWGSRYANTQSHKLFGDKPVLLLSTSPGPNGGASNLALLAQLLPFQGANIVGQYSRGSYGDHFDANGKADADTQTALREALKPLLAQL